MILGYLPSSTLAREVPSRPQAPRGGISDSCFFSEETLVLDTGPFLSVFVPALMSQRHTWDPPAFKS